MTTSPTSSTSPDEKTWAMFTHLSALSGYVIPFGNILGPLILWQLKKDQMPLVDDQGREALNFQITIAIIGVALAVLSLVGIGFLLIAPLVLYQLVFAIIASVKSHDGEKYRYPFTLRLVN